MYLVHGQPGSGKTMLGMHFLEEGLEEGGTTLFIHGEESEEEILANGAAVGIDIGDSEFLDVGPDPDFFTEDYTYDLVEPSDLEEDRYTKDIHEAIRRIDPDRWSSTPSRSFGTSRPTSTSSESASSRSCGSSRSER